MSEREATITGINGEVTYDPSLIDAQSDAYAAGHREGLASTSDVPQQARPSTMSDAEWASYCEGFLMGWCEVGRP